MRKKKNTGFLVETKTRKKGKIFPFEEFINDKIVVHIETFENPILCEPDSLKILTTTK